jgi:hypothetical protein
MTSLVMVLLCFLRQVSLTFWFLPEAAVAEGPAPIIKVEGAEGAEAILPKMCIFQQARLLCVLVLVGLAVQTMRGLVALPV